MSLEIVDGVRIDHRQTRNSASRGHEEIIQDILDVDEISSKFRTDAHSTNTVTRTRATRSESPLLRNLDSNSGNKELKQTNDLPRLGIGSFDYRASRTRENNSLPAPGLSRNKNMKHQASIENEFQSPKSPQILSCNDDMRKLRRASREPSRTHKESPPNAFPKSEDPFSDDKQTDGAQPHQNDEHAVRQTGRRSELKKEPKASQADQDRTEPPPSTCEPVPFSRVIESSRKVCTPRRSEDLRASILCSARLQSPSPLHLPRVPDLSRLEEAIATITYFSIATNDFGDPALTHRSAGQAQPRGHRRPPRPSRRQPRWRAKDCHRVLEFTTTVAAAAAAAAAGGSPCH